MKLKKKALFGFFWVFADTFILKSLQFIALIFLARWIGPKEFGLIGMMAIFIELGRSLTDSGLSNSLIRTKAANNSDYSTVFFANLIMSLLVYIVVFTLAPYIAVFYNQPSLLELIRVYCLIFLFIALSAVQIAILAKKMEFGKITRLNFPAMCLGVMTGLYLGYHGHGIWSVIWMYLITEGLKSVLLWSYSNWRPQFIFSKSKFKHHFNFGYKLMLSELVSTIFKNIYNILIGKFFASQILGYYERSRQLGQYPSATLTGVMSKVTYPLLSEIQEDKELLEKTYIKLIRVSFFVIAPVMLCTAAIAKPLFLLLLGKEWLPAVIFFQILSLAMMLYPIHSFNLNILKVFGRSDLFLRLEIIKKVIAVITITIAFQYGVMGLVWSSVVTSFAALSVNMFYSSRLINYSILAQLKDLGLTFFIALLTAILMYYFAQTLINIPLILQLLLSYTFGGLFYLGTNWLNKRSPLYLTLNLLKYR